MRRCQSVLVARLAVGAIALMGGALWSCCGNDVPIRPSYRINIAPLMEAHCTRCHGAGGTLNGDPDSPGVLGQPAGGPPTNGDFTSLAGSNGHKGLSSYNAALMKTYIESGPMPPPPAPPLTDWEYTMLLEWCDNQIP